MPSAATVGRHGGSRLMDQAWPSAHVLSLRTSTEHLAMILGGLAADGGRAAAAVGLRSSVPFTTISAWSLKVSGMTPA